ncbi:NAD(P)H-binding protein [Streptosporangium sp. NPDC051023]|uniref:NAD(P)H-binding protein n=1 Tax=Streptosporangium sp. NPDC051023 TaxID=3155410 RepID=UPI0034500073
MILITGGRGAVATRLLSLVTDAGLAVRVGSAEPAQLTLPEGIPAVRLDLTAPSTFASALAGVRSVFLYASASHLDTFLDEAGRAGVQHIVLLSSAAVLSPDAETSAMAKSHLDAERAVQASPITATILRPGSFAANATGWAWAIKTGKPVRLPYPGAYNDPIHERDIAEAAYTVLTQPRHHGGVYDLTGPETLTFAEQLDQLAKAVGQPITVEQVTPAEWKEAMAEHLPPNFADSILDYWKSTDGKPVPLTDVVQKLTGHPGRTFAEWAADHAAEFAS